VGAPVRIPGTFAVVLPGILVSRVISPIGYGD